MNDQLQKILDELRKPFHPSQITWKPGAVKGDRAMAIAYADLRAYMNRLDEVCGYEWSVAYEPWGTDRIICRLTVGSVTRSSTGEMGAQDEKNEMGGTVAEAQAFKRACSMFGLGRYLYTLPSGWVDYDAQTKKFTEKAKAHLQGMLVQHYRRAIETAQNATQASQQAAVPAEDANTPADTSQVQPERPRASEAQLKKMHALGVKFHGGKEEWDAARPKWVETASTGAVTSSNDLMPKEADWIINALEKRINEKAAQETQPTNGASKVAA